MDLFDTLSPDGSPIFLANLPVKQGAGRVGHQWAHNEAELEHFIIDYDRPGRALYFCVAQLRDDSTARNKENVESVNWLWAEIDFKDHPDITADEIRRRIETSPLPPSLLVTSGHGLHLYWKMKESVDASPGPAQQTVEDALKLACHYVGGDPSAAEAARLLRLPGSHNRKNGSAIPVQIVGDNKHTYELDDLVNFWLEARPIIPASVKTDNGDSAGEETDDDSGPIDVDARLRDMRWKGPGQSGIHTTQLQITASLLRSGVAADTAVAEVLKATQDAIANNPDTANWDWAAEQRKIELMCYDFVSKNPELSTLLPDYLQTQFEAALTAGKRPKISRNAAGFHVRGYATEQHQDKKPDDNATAADAKAASKKSLFVLKPFTPFDLAGLPPREWLYGRHYQRRTVSATIAPGGYGKTTLCMVEAVAMATCRNLLGEQPAQRLRVWYHNGEDNLEELRRRLGAICLHHNIPQEELRDWFFMTSGNEVPLRVATGYNDLKIDQALIKRIGEAVETNQIDVAILDPLVTLHSVPEADNTKMDAVIRIFAGIADGRDCSVELAHHTRKLPAGSNGNDYVAADIRGASALRDAVRAARMLNQMNEEDARNSGIPEHERVNYFRVDRVKANNAPAARALWRRFVNVDLPNGDEVGVVTPFNFPGQGAPSPQKAKAEQDAENLFTTLLARLTLQGRSVSDRPGVSYAPHVFSLEPEAKTPGIGKAALADAMRRLFLANRIRVEPAGKGDRYRRVVAV